MLAVGRGENFDLIDYTENIGNLLYYDRDTHPSDSFLSTISCFCIAVCCKINQKAIPKVSGHASETTIIRTYLLIGGTFIHLEKFG